MIAARMLDPNLDWFVMPTPPHALLSLDCWEKMVVVCNPIWAATTAFPSTYGEACYEEGADSG